MQKGEKSCWTSFYKEAEAVKWKDALRAAMGVAIFAIAAVIFDSVDRIENGRRDLRQWSQGCLVRQSLPMSCKNADHSWFYLCILFSYLMLKLAAHPSHKKRTGGTPLTVQDM
jgi:hypothetical protein